MQPEEKLIAIHEGGDWADAGAEYLIVPKSINISEELKRHREWYHKYYSRNKEKFYTASDWIREKVMCREVDDNDIEIHDAT